jgi:DNA-binding transcriptional LysR family regulator
MNYTLNQLRIFIKVVENMSITKASEELHLTQPAVSIQLKNFQDQFEIPLIEIVGKKVHVTEFGSEVADAAKKIIEQANEITYKSLAYKGSLIGKLKLTIVSTGKYVMPYFLSEFLKQNPGIKLNMDVTNKSKVIESLKQNEVDFSLVSILPKSPKVEGVKLLQNKLYLVGSSKSKPPAYKSTKKLFENLPLIFREKGSGTRQSMESFLQANNAPALKKLELTSNEAVKQAVLADLGYSIMPLIGIKNELLNGQLQVIPVKKMPIITDWQLIWPKGKRHNPAAKALLEFIKKEKEIIINKQFSWYEQF